MCLCEPEGDRDQLPHQEARMSAGLEKALQHKDKLLEYDKNRYLINIIYVPNVYL